MQTKVFSVELGNTETCTRRLVNTTLCSTSSIAELTNSPAFESCLLDSQPEEKPISRQILYLLAKRVKRVPCISDITGLAYRQFTFAVIFANVRLGPTLEPTIWSPKVTSGTILKDC